MGNLLEGALVTIDNHEDAAAYRLVPKLRNKQTVRDLAEVIGARVQILEDVFEDIRTQLSFNSASANMLDLIGGVLGLNRQGFSDADYKTFLRAKAEILIPKRRNLEGLLSLARALMGPKTLQSVEPFIFDPDMSTLVDRISTLVGTATGTSYNATSDSRNFDGIDDHINWPNIQDLTDAPFSWSGFVTPVTTTTTDRFMSLQRADNADAIYLHFQPAGSVELVYVATAARRTLGALTAGVGTHLVVTYDGLAAPGSIRIFFDGLEQAYVSEAALGPQARAADGIVTLGGTDSGTLPYEGNMRDVLMWDRVLAPAEVVTVFHEGARFIDFVEFYPKAYILTLEDITATEELIFQQFLRVARPATYNGMVLVVPVPAFGYSDSTGAVTTTTLGFDNASAPPTFGGPYAHVLPL